MYTVAIIIDMEGKKKKSLYQRVSPENMERIEKMGTFGESFNDVLGRLLDNYEKC